MLVLATVEKDAELADNLTELIIARVAQRGGTEIAGKEEFRARLGVENERRAQACLDDIACLGRAAVSLGVRRIVAGSVGTRGKQFLFNLNLDNVETGKVENRVFRLVDGGVEELIRAVQEGTDELFTPHVEPGKIQIASIAGGRARVDRQRLPGRDAADLGDVAGRQAQRPRRSRRAFPLDVEGRGPAVAGAADQAHRRQPARAPPLARIRRLRIGIGLGARAGDRRLPGRALADPADRNRPRRRAAATSIRRSTSRARPTSRSARAQFWLSYLCIISYVTETTFLGDPRSTTRRPSLPRQAMVTVRRTA